MRVGVLFEASGIVRDAFAARGHDAISVDVRPSQRPGPHVVDDVFAFLGTQAFADLDLVIMHPPCTFLARSGLHWNNRVPGRHACTLKALDDVRRLMEACRGKRWALENPPGAIGSAIRKPTQTVQPYEYGHDASKMTCLWMDGLLPLRPNPAMRVPGRIARRPDGRPVERWSNQTDGGENNVPERKDRWAIRSQTYQGIADGMAEAWG